MSRRRSTGDLVPKEISEILAREARIQRGQKKSGSSLGHAFSWFKGSRKKKSIGNGLNRAVIGVTDAKLQNPEPAKTGQKANEDQKRLTVHYTTSQHYQENVFIEGNRPQYLEDLHTEAQEGLKILQQEENKNGVNFPDNESIASTDTLRPEQDISSKDGGFSLESRSTAGSTDTTVTSAVSTRPVLTRQGSTFKPLNPVKRLDRSRKRSRRTTIMGIPNQVQKELALHRTSTFQQLVSTQPLNQDGLVRTSQSGVLIIPTVDGGTPVANKEGARVHLSELEHASRDEQPLSKHLHAMNQNQQPFNLQGFGPTSNLRPKSLAVPGMTTSCTFSSASMLSFLQEPQGPVMSVSPQATYLSTIIPNAVLPASVEVIEIDRSSSRTRGSINHSGSVRAVSKSSLASGDSSVSPLLSRRSVGDGSQADTFHNSSKLMPTSDSGSNWSEPQSSKTLISHSSPGSSKGSTHSSHSQRATPNGQETLEQRQGHCGDNDLVSLRSSVSMSSSRSESVFTGQGCESGVSGLATPGEDGKTKQNFARSLSVMKTKQPPAPPRRTNSLHGNRIRSNSRVLIESKELNESVSVKLANDSDNTVVKDKISSVAQDTIKNPVPNSTGPISCDASTSPLSPTQTTEKATEHKSECTNSSPQKTTSEGGKFERTMSPSSGYSSQSGTPTLSPKGISPTSPEKQKKIPVKPDRSASRASSSAASPSSSLTSLSSSTSESVHPHVSTCSPSPPPQGSFPNAATKEHMPKHSPASLGAEVRELLNIPPPPKVQAPCSPPPETWAHNRRSFELLCGPCPDVGKVTQKPAEVQDCAVKQAGTQTEAIDEIKALDEKQSTLDKSTSVLPENIAKPEAEPEKVPANKELENRESADSQDQTEAVTDTQKQEQRSNPEVKLSESQETPKKEPPPVMKKPLAVLHREELKKAFVDRPQNHMSSSATKEAAPVKNSTVPSQDGVSVLADKSENDTEREVPPMQTLSVEVPKISRTSPPPTPPPAYHPTPPLSRKTPTSSVSMPPDDLERVQEESHVAETCWPPPPPPMEGDSVFDGGDEVDFPPPPPPFVTESVPKVVDSDLVELGVSKGPTEEVEEKTEDASEAGSSVREETPDVSQAVQPEADVQVLEANSCDEIACRLEQNVLLVSDDAQPLPPVGAPFSLPVMKEENSETVSDVAPSSTALMPESMVTENPLPSEPPVAPPLPAENLAQGVNFRRQHSVANRDTRSKELLSRHKSAPIPKEDANIPLVTPSLLQMVRLRSVNVAEDPVKPPSEEKPTNHEAPALENSTVLTPGPQNTPQKPIRKSLSLKSPPKTVKTSSVTLTTPSMRLQEAIRMKTAAMSSRDCLTSRLGVRSAAYSFVSEQKSPDGHDVHKSPANTASFIFSRSTKKVVIEPMAASCPEVQASLKQSLAAELLQLTDQSKTTGFSNGGMKSDKVPPPVAKKPAHGSACPSQILPAYSAKMDLSVGGNGAIGVQNVSGITYPETTTRVTADTIETLF